MGAKKQLSEDVKRFIVKSLAVFESPSDVMLSVKEKFKVSITRAGIQTYDPTKVAGEDLSEDLKTLFFETRKNFEETEIIPLSKKIYRIKKLAKFVENAESLGNDVAAAAYLEQIAKEEGGMFTNKREISGAGGESLAQPIADAMNQFASMALKVYGEPTADNNKSGGE